MSEAMQNLNQPEMLRLAMRHWPSGVAIAASAWQGDTHGMTVNSFVSHSIDPAVVSVTMANASRTCELVRHSQAFGVTLLTAYQQDLSDRFAGRIDDAGDRMVGVEWFALLTGSPLLNGGNAFLDCRVTLAHDLGASTLFVAQVVSVRLTEHDMPPLAYFNRHYCRVEMPEE